MLREYSEGWEQKFIAERRDYTMQIELLHKLLSDLAVLADSSGASSISRDLSEFQNAFPTGEKLTVAKFVGRLQQSQQPSSTPLSPSVQRLRQFLLAVERVLSNAPKDAGKDIVLLSALLESCHDETVRDFVTKVQDRCSAQNSKKPGAPKDSKIVRTEVVETYVRNLQSFEQDNVAFDETVQNLKGDRRVREQEMKEIATRYLGYKFTKKKNDAWQAIIDRQAVDARQRARKPHQIG
jgi:hypothetical protein